MLGLELCGTKSCMTAPTYAAGLHVDGQSCIKLQLSADSWVPAGRRTFCERRSRLSMHKLDEVLAVSVVDAGRETLTQR